MERLDFNKKNLTKALQEIDGPSTSAVAQALLEHDCVGEQNNPHVNPVNHWLNKRVKCTFSSVFVGESIAWIFNGLIVHKEESKFPRKKADLPIMVREFIVDFNGGKFAELQGMYKPWMAGDDN